AAIECDPSARPEVVNVAWAVDVPAMSFKPGLRVTVASTVAPSLKATVPEGLPLPPPLTVAVNVTAWPGAVSADDDVSEVTVLVGCRIDWSSATDVPPAKVLSPP